MGEVQVFKHACKFCNKSFPCGRSLGGHMRSHLTNNSNNNSNSAKKPEAEKKLKITTKFNTETSSSVMEAGGYGLRENPKKTWRFADIIPAQEEASSHLQQQQQKGEEPLFLDENSFRCKQCGRDFQSWKSLSGHRKSHQDSPPNSANSQVNLVLDSQSDNETAAPNRNKKKKNRRTPRRARCNNLGTAKTATDHHNYVSSLVSEIDQQEQEEVARCLMMLSRDPSGFKSVAESSDNFSEFSKSQTSRITSTPAGKACENFPSPDGKLWSKMSRTEVSSDGVFRKDKISSVSDQSGSKKLNSSKRNGNFEAELRSDCLKISDPDQMMCRNSQKRSKFECTTCNKTFHSYQALGGHRASHKKSKGCFASTIESSENSIETDEENKPRNHHFSNEISPVDHDLAPLESKTDQQQNTTVMLKKSKGHECPICLKVFPSGQALGGHKRSHQLIGGGGGGGSDAKNITRPPATAVTAAASFVTETPIPEIRDLLDLNLPAPTDEEDSNGHLNNTSLEPWWAGSSHKHEALVGLIS